MVAGLLLSFNLAAASVLARGIDVENCGCTSVKAGAPERSPFRGVGWFLLARNRVLLAAALAVAFPSHESESPCRAARPRPRPRTVSDMVTRGVRVRVKSAYVPERSSPPQGHYFFAYHVRIANEGDETVQLVSRHWIITDGDGREEQVQGSGGRGRAARAGPRRGLRVHELLPAATPIGSMHGTYQMVTPGGDQFDATIAPFSLAVPTALN